MSNILPTGKLDRVIVIEQATTNKGSDYGEITQSWSEFATVYANVFSGGGREFEAARQVNAEIDTQFQIRWIFGVSPSMRIALQNDYSPASTRYYDILRVQEVGRRQRINIWARARQE